MERLKHFSLSALMIALAALTACSSEDNIVNDQPVNPTAPKTYTMIVQATKGDAAATRGLYFNGTALNVKWNEGEKVVVMQDEDELGTLTATPDPDDPTKATLRGELDKLDLEEDIEFHLHSASYDYSRQSGVLLSKDCKDGENSIEENFDYALCTVKAGSDKIKTSVVKNPDGDKYYLVTIEGGITLESQQAIVKFTLVDKADATTPMNVTRLEVNDGYYNIFVVPSNPSNELYVAVNSDGDELDYHLKAVTATGDVYTYDHREVTFLCGKYYEVKVKMTKQQPATIDLSKLTDAYIAVNGDVLTGTLGGRYKISITDGATVTLRNVTIEGYDDKSDDWAGITCEGDATIVIEGTNSIQGFYHRYPGISVPIGKTLTIRGSGSLEAKSNQGKYIHTGPSGNQTTSQIVSGSGIGGSINEDCGNIVIESGTITATGSYRSAGIGSSEQQSCGTITITGGIVTATGGENAAGIGSAYTSNCGNITITGGTVTATGGKDAAAIGSGRDSFCSDITIGGSANVTATKGEGSTYCIGLGKNGTVGEKTCGTITIGGTEYYNGSTKTWGSEALENALKAETFTYPAP